MVHHCSSIFLVYFSPSSFIMSLRYLKQISLYLISSSNPVFNSAWLNQTIIRFFLLIVKLFCIYFFPDEDRFLVLAIINQTLKVINRGANSESAENSLFFQVKCDPSNITVFIDEMNCVFVKDLSFWKKKNLFQAAALHPGD